MTTGGLIQPLSFEQGNELGQVSAMWQPVIRGSAVASFAMDSQRAFIGTQSQQMTFVSGQGAVGFANRGLNHWGLNLLAAKPYEGYVWARAATATNLTAALESGDGSKVYTEQTLNVAPGDWQRINFSITPNSTDHEGRFVLELKQPGTVTLGYVFLQRGSWGRFKELPVRRDIVEGLLDQGVSIIRYGGSMVNSPEYPVEKDDRPARPPAALCRHMVPLFLQRLGHHGLPESLRGGRLRRMCPTSTSARRPQDMADFIEYVNGPADSPWGRRRAADGHPAPYHLTYLELGNEERVDENYAAKFNGRWPRPSGPRTRTSSSWSATSVTGTPIIDPDHIAGATAGSPISTVSSRSSTSPASTIARSGSMSTSGPSGLEPSRRPAGDFYLHRRDRSRSPTVPRTRWSCSS